jgi:hypothetical protein
VERWIGEEENGREKSDVEDVNKLMSVRTCGEEERSEKVEKRRCEVGRIEEEINKVEETGEGSKMVRK